jgi:hypothetical protein
MTASLMVPSSCRVVPSMSRAISQGAPVVIGSG